MRARKIKRGAVMCQRIVSLTDLLLLILDCQAGKIMESLIQIFNIKTHNFFNSVIFKKTILKTILK